MTVFNSGDSRWPSLQCLWLRKVLHLQSLQLQRICAQVFNKEDIDSPWSRASLLVSLNPLTSKFPPLLLHSICSSSQTLYLLYFCASHTFPPSPPPLASPWSSVTGKWWTDLPVSRYYTIRLVCQRYQSCQTRTHPAPALPHLHPITHAHECLCTQVLKCAQRLTYSPKYKQEHDVSLSLTQTDTV